MLLRKTIIMNETSSTTEVTGFRAWVRKKARVITLYAGTLGAILTVAVAWDKLDLPRPVLTTDLAELRVQVVENSQLILGDRWFRLKSDIRRVEAKLRAVPGDRDLIAQLTRLEQQLREVEKKLK